MKPENRNLKPETRSSRSRGCGLWRSNFEFLSVFLALLCSIELRALAAQSPFAQV